MMKIDLQIERIISEIKRGQKVVVYDSISQISVLLSAAELVHNTTLNEHISMGLSFPNIILSSQRCNALGIKTNKNCSFLIDGNWSRDELLAIALDQKNKSNFKIEGLIEENSKIVDSCLELLKQSKLLPTGIMTLLADVNFNQIVEWSNENNLISLNVNDLLSSDPQKFDDLQIVAKAHLPIQQTNECDIIVFRSDDSVNEYFCLLIGKAREKFKNSDDFVPIVRMHSQCITGDILNSLKCDCGDQLKSSLDFMVQKKQGILIYLSQEGRNIGLTNKLRAYKLQEEGLDTVDANLTLGFSEDERNYGIASKILKKLNVKTVRLITNNPVKIQELERMKIKVLERIAISTKVNPFNKSYLNTKRVKTGHYI